MGWQLFGNTNYFSLTMCQGRLIFQLQVNIVSISSVYLESLFILYSIASLDFKSGRMYEKGQSFNTVPILLIMRQDFCFVNMPGLVILLIIDLVFHTVISFLQLWHLKRTCMLL